MGLDGVELVMAVEEEFKIAISDSDAAQCVTVGKLVDFVLSRLRQNTQEPCASQHGFYVVRRQLMNSLGIARTQIKPETRLDDLIPQSERRKRWQDLGASFRGHTTNWPELVRPKWVDTGLFALMVATWLVLGFLAWLPFVEAVVPAILLGLVGFCLTLHLKRDFPRRFSQVRDLVQFITTLDSGVWSKEEVFQKVRAITVEQLGVKESQVTLESSFVDDLGIG